MLKVNYLELIKKAFQITWSHRYLWWLGLFVALTETGGYVNYSLNNPSGNEEANKRMAEFLAVHWQGFLTAFSFILLVLIIFLILGIIARGGLIKSVGKILKNEPSDFKSGFKEGRKYFWRIFLAGLALGIFVMAAILILAIPVVFLFVNKAYLSGIILAVIAIIILIPLLFLVSFLRVYGYL